MFRVLLYTSCLILITSVLTKNNSNVFSVNFFQNDYKADFERYESVRFNKKYVKRFKAITFKYNRTCAAVNTTLILSEDLNNDMDVIVQAYMFASNEYRLFPLRFQFNYCVGLDSNIVGLSREDICQSREECPLKKDVIYKTCNFSPNTSKMPPLLPNGRYMIELQGIYFSEEVFLARAYFSVTRPIVFL